jgi:DNA-binding beta-propeller fold protein YncE
MARLWRTRIASWAGLPIGVLLVATMLSSCLPTAVIADGSPGCSTAQAVPSPLSGVQTALVSVNGSPFDVATAGDLSFVSLGSSIGVFSDASFAPSLVRTVALPESVAGEAVTPDGRFLLAATNSGVIVLSLWALVLGVSNAVVGSLSAPGGGGGIEVTVSPDGHFVFVSLESTGDIAVFDLQAALTGGFSASDFVGTIPLGEAPVGMALAPGGQYLYAVSETAGPGATQGSLSVIDLALAETSPQASVRSAVTAGCGAVRVVTSDDGSVVWVTARESDQLLAFSAPKLLADPSGALVAQVEVGEAPVGVALVDSGAFAVVANSNRFSAPGATASLSVVDTAAALGGKPALVGQLSSGAFPRQLALEPNGQTLLVTNFDSGQLEAVNVSQIPP